MISDEKLFSYYTIYMVVYILLSKPYVYYRIVIICLWQWNEKKKVLIMIDYYFVLMLLLGMFR